MVVNEPRQKKGFLLPCRACWFHLLPVWIIILMTGISAAQPLSVEVHGTYAFEFDGTQKNQSVHTGIDEGLGGGGSISYSLGPHLKLDLGLDYLRVEKNETEPANGDYIEVIPLTAAFRAGGNISDALFVYAGGGGGFSFNRLETENGDGLRSNIRDAPIYFFSAGTDIALSEAVSLRAEARYHLLAVEVFTDSRQDDLSLDHGQIRLGLSFSF